MQMSGLRVASERRRALAYAEAEEAARSFSQVIHPTALVNAGTTKRVTGHWTGLVCRYGFVGLVSSPDKAAQVKGKGPRRNPRATTPIRRAPFPPRRRHKATSSKIG